MRRGAIKFCWLSLLPARATGPSNACQMPRSVIFFFYYLDETKPGIYLPATRQFAESCASSLFSKGTLVQIPGCSADPWCSNLLWYRPFKTLLDAAGQQCAAWNCLEDKSWFPTSGKYLSVFPGSGFTLRFFYPYVVLKAIRFLCEFMTTYRSYNNLHS